MVIGGEQSACLPVVSGVPQRSVLGPLLPGIYFYVNEITSSIPPYSRISMFADDISFYCSINAPIDYMQFQDDISAIVQWVKKTF